MWFKFDAATAIGIANVNGVRLSPEAHLRRLRSCAEVCPTWIQSCFFKRNGKQPTATDMAAYVAAIAQVADVVEGVYLYGLARQSMQPEAALLGRLPEEWFKPLAEKLRKLGVKVTINP